MKNDFEATCRTGDGTGLYIVVYPEGYIGIELSTKYEMLEVELSDKDSKKLKEFFIEQSLEGS